MTALGFGVDKKRQVNAVRAVCCTRCGRVELSTFVSCMLGRLQCATGAPRPAPHRLGPRASIPHHYKECRAYGYREGNGRKEGMVSKCAEDVTD
jgi:hypothetical protein